MKKEKMHTRKSLAEGTAGLFFYMSGLILNFVSAKQI